MGNFCCCAFKGIVNPKMKIVSSFTHPRSKPVKPSFIFGAQIKIFLIKSESFLAPSVSWYSREWQQRLTLKRRNHWIKLFLFFFTHKKYSCSWCHMDYFNDVFTTFLGLEHFSCFAVYAGSESSWIHQKYLNCVRKMNEGLTGLERHEGV